MEQPKHTRAWQAMAEHDTAEKGIKPEKRAWQWLRKGSGHSAPYPPSYVFPVLLRRPVQEGCTLQRAGSLPERLLWAPGIPGASVSGSSPRGSQRSPWLMACPKSSVNSALPLSESSNLWAPGGHWAGRCPDWWRDGGSRMAEHWEFAKSSTPGQPVDEVHQQSL